MLELILHAVIHTAKHTAVLLPFLFLTYLLLEWLEHYAAEKTASIAAKAGKFGPAIGGLMGAVPQCGLSASAANLYSGGIISIGTLIAIFISTSDEMLPIMISSQIKVPRILAILGIKVALGILVGFLVDFLLRFRRNAFAKEKITHICHEENCHCEERGIFHSAILHTIQVAFFIFLISFALEIVISLIGEDQLSAFAANAGVFGPLVAGLVGLIPNCASSVVLTELFLGGIISTGTMIAGLAANSGVGLLVLFRINKNIRANLFVTAVIYGSGVLVGILFDGLRIVL